jgi:hypothetical protein
MQKYLITAVIIAVAVLVEASVIMHVRQTGVGSAKASGWASQNKRPTPTPRPTPRPNMNDGGGVYERGNANSNGNKSHGVAKPRPRNRPGHQSGNANNSAPHTEPGTVDLLPNASESGETDTGTRAKARRVRRPPRRARRRAPPTNTEFVEPETTGGASADRTKTPAHPADLSGTYTGMVSDEARAVTGEKATLTIASDRYTLESESLSYSGRFIVNTTRGYRAVMMELGPQAPEQSPSPFVSVRARRVGANRLTLTSVAGERRRFSFVSMGSNVARMRRR